MSAYGRCVDAIDGFLVRCELGEPLRGHVREVMRRLPPDVLRGLLSDEGFVLREVGGGGGGFVVPPPGRSRPTRAVVLKRRMWRDDAGFVRWVIAHELAHAHLHNRGRFDGEDPELAADALAAEWGFERPWPVGRGRRAV